MTGTERFTSDTKDVDITGAMFVCNNGLHVFLCCLQQGVVLAIDRGGLMGDPVATPEVRALDRMKFPSAALFERDNAELSDEAKALLGRNIQTGRDMFRRANAIIIVGHTDDKWDADYNMKLSKERAATVRDYLISQGVDSTKMVTTGAGETMPIADNTTRAGRAANRRVQVLVLGRAK